MSDEFELFPTSENLPRKALELRPAAVPMATGRTPINGLGFDIFEPLRILFRRRLCISLCTLTIFGAAVLVCMMTPPIYVATSRIQLLNQEMGRLSLNDGGGSEGFDFYATLQTDVNVMQSDTLTLQVIKELNLADGMETGYDPRMKTAEARRQLALPLDEAPLKRTAILKSFRAKLSVDIVPGSRMIMVSYADRDPEQAAKIVNQLVSDFIEYNFRVQYNSTTKATDFLGRQLVDLKSEVEKSQERAVQLQKSSGMFGADEYHNIIATRLEQLNNEVVAAEANRIAKEAVYNLATTGDPELIAGLLGASSAASGGGAAGPAATAQIRNSQPLITHLRQEEADLNAQYAEALTKYGPAYPRLIQMKERLSALKSSIQAELNRVAESAKSEYELAAAQEAAARKIFAEQKAAASSMNDKAIAYTIAKHEADSNRVLYENLLQKLKEAGVLAGLRSSDLNVLDPATVPGRPAKPRIPLYLAGGLLSGLSLGVISAFLLESLDRTMRNPEEIENTTRTAVLGIVPQGKALERGGAKRWLRSYSPSGSRPGSAFINADDYAIAEAFRWVRTSLLMQQLKAPPKLVMIASAVPQEGKSFAALNLAAALAQNGGRVLLVDADLRRGTLSRNLNQPGVGLSDLLTGTVLILPYWAVGEVPGLTILPAGMLAVSPVELLASSKMTALMENWRREFTHVVIDTPPVLPVPDAVVLAPQVDTVLVVARSAFTHRQSIARAMRVLREAHARRVHVLLNSVDIGSPEYTQAYGSDGYYGYGYGTSYSAPSRPSRSTPKG